MTEFFLFFEVNYYRLSYLWVTDEKRNSFEVDNYMFLLKVKDLKRYHYYEGNVFHDLTDTLRFLTHHTTVFFSSKTAQFLVFMDAEF